MEQAEKKIHPTILNWNDWLMQLMPIAFLQVPGKGLNCFLAQEFPPSNLKLPDHYRS